MPSRLLLLTLSGFLLAGCGGDSGGETETAPRNRRVEIRFRGFVNGANFRCGETYQNVGIGPVTAYRVNDFRFYLHDVVLLTQDRTRVPVELIPDNRWQVNDTVMIDLEDGCLNGTPEMNPQIIGEVPEDTYRSICFKLGLPFDENHADLAVSPAPLNASGMLWNWRAGRKFVRFDGVGDPGGLNQSFHIHLGSTECPGTSGNAPPIAACGFANVAEICLNNFNPDRHTIAVDGGRVLANSNVTVNTPQTSSGCMSGNNDPECIAIMPRLGLDFTFFPGAGVPSEFHPKVEQQFFSVIQ